MAGGNVLGGMSRGARAASSAQKGLKAAKSAASATAKGAKSAAQTAKNTVTTTSSKALAKVDDALGVVPGKVSKSGKELSLNSQRASALGKAGGKIVENAADIYTGGTILMDAVEDMIGGGSDNVNTDGGDGAPTGAPQPEPPKPAERPDPVTAELEAKATPAVQNAAKNVLAEKGDPSAKPGRDEYLSALSTVNRYESNCQSDSGGTAKPAVNPITQIPKEKSSRLSGFNRHQFRHF